MIAGLLALAASAIRQWRKPGACSCSTAAAWVNKPGGKPARNQGDT